jgi:hypothetical protein
MHNRSVPTRISLSENEDGDCRDVAEYETRHGGWDSGGATLGVMLLFAGRSAARR